MRISKLAIKNFRAVRFFEISNLKDTVVIAGPNGCGKSCILDAIRLLKSCYGGYQPNEWEQWFNEFQINFSRPGKEWARALRDPNKPLEITATFSLSQAEREYIKLHGRELASDIAWIRVLPTTEDRFRGNLANRQISEPRVTEAAEQMNTAVSIDLNDETFEGYVSVDPTGQINVRSCPILELAFSTYDPKHIGVIDFHSANRTYGREQVGGINLSIENVAQHQRQHALYNYGGKYQNIKSEMAAAYIRDLIAREAGGANPDAPRIVDTLKELFNTFFPGKRFLGPMATDGGALEFPVEVAGGTTHDINDLSSGEKEVVYGYLRLRNTAPCNSILLLDEPELHLNPRLIRGLPQFYQRHLGTPLGNQLWLITHSDAFLRQTVDEPDYSVYHMQPPSGSAIPANQAQLISAGAALERAVIDLVGDLASYRPGAKVVIFEGEGSEFDIKMVGLLFPEFQSAVNTISAGSKARVQQLHALLEAATSAGNSDVRFYSVVDRDWSSEEPVASNSQLTWDAYHIENYLLNPGYIRRALRELTLGSIDIREEEVGRLLHECASELVNDHITHRLREIVNYTIVRCIKLNPGAINAEIAQGLQGAAIESVERMTNTFNGELALDRLTEESTLREELESALNDETWSRKFPGRDILKRFVNRTRPSAAYEQFRNIVIARMKDDGFQPEGMKSVLSRILDS